jgi:CubicO group peptidase (beta-lactamase class C family)/D-alanyl-D-alanine dipeptidase
MRTFLTAVLIPLLATFPNRASAAKPLPKEVVSQVEAVIQETLKEKHIPGLTVAIATANRLRYEGAFGLADVEHQVPTKTTTRFRTASIAKPMTSTLILRLMEEGKLNLDEHVQTYCENFPEKKWPVTTRQLLGHLGGVRHYKVAGEATDTRHFFNLKSALSVFKDDPLTHEPGTKFQYTSFGYNLLGSVAEGAGDSTFMTLLGEHVLTPCSMKHTRTDDHLAVIPDRARGYIRFTKKTLPRSALQFALKPDTLYRSPLHDTSMKIPGGGLVATSGDLVRFATALNRGEILNAATLDLAWTKQKTKDGKETGYGLGWGIGRLGEQNIVLHGGAQSGTATYLLLIPESGIAVAAMSNLQGTSLKDLTQTLAGIVSRTEPRESVNYGDAISKLKTVIKREVNQKELPAFSITLVDNKRDVWSAGFGFAGTEPKRGATSETVYRVGSISKLFTDIAVMQLVEQGKLNLDADIREILPTFQPKNPFEKPLTLRQLMSHRSGLVRESPVGSYFDPDEPSIAETVASLNDTTIVYEPGTRTKYSNSGITVVGLAVEKASGMPFSEYVREKILKPIGMQNSDFDRTPKVAEKLAAAQMWTVDGRRFPAPVFEFGIFPAGNLYSTTDDLTRFLRVLFRGGHLKDGQLLSPETLSAMMRPQEKDRFGIGFAISDFHGHKAIGHGGAVYGYSTQLKALIDEKIGVAAVTSLDGSNGVVGRISNYALELMLAARAGKPLPDYQTTEPIPKELARSTAGTYQNGDSTITLTERAGRLFMRRGSYRNELRALADSFVVDDILSFGLRVKVKNRDELIIDGQSWKRVEVQKPKNPPSHWKWIVGAYGWDHNTLYLFEHRGQLHALIEWFYFYPLTEVEGKGEVYAFPDYGLYHGEEIHIRRNESSYVPEIIVAGIEFKRRRDGPYDNEIFQIEPVKPVEDLRAAALAAKPPEEKSEFRASELVDVAKLDDSIKLDIRYATTNNFMGAVFYKQPRAFMQKRAAEALVRVHRRLKERGYGLLIHDAYRPWFVTKMFWDATPDDLKDFVANPQKGSRHNRGCAVDITLYDLKTGKPVPMVAQYDEFTPRAFPGYPGGTSLQRWHRELLREEMQREGFEVYEFEWWHFDYKDWKNYRIGTKTFEEIEAAEGSN